MLLQNSGTRLPGVGDLTSLWTTNLGPALNPVSYSPPHLLSVDLAELVSISRASRCEFLAVSPSPEMAVLTGGGRRSPGQCMAAVQDLPPVSSMGPGTWAFL